jgi:hypothetical protein
LDARRQIGEAPASDQGVALGELLVAPTVAPVGPPEAAGLGEEARNELEKAHGLSPVLEFRIPVAQNRFQAINDRSRRSCFETRRFAPLLSMKSGS